MMYCILRNAYIDVLKKKKIKKPSAGIEPVSLDKKFQISSVLTIKLTKHF